MTSWPCSASSAAATDESTPPDIATTIRIRQTQRQPVFVSSWRVVSCRDGLLRKAPEFVDQPRQDLDHSIDLFHRREEPEAEPERILRPMRRKPHRAEHVRRF